MSSTKGNAIKARKKGNDVFYTPVKLVKEIMTVVKDDLKDGDKVLDAFCGKKVFYNNYPPNVVKDWAEISEGRDFFECGETDWIITNPPYSILNKVIDHSAKICKKGFGYLIHYHNLTTPRVNRILKDFRFRLTKMYLCNVHNWYSSQVFVLFEKIADDADEETGEEFAPDFQNAINPNYYPDGFNCWLGVSPKTIYPDDDSKKDGQK